MAKSGGKIVARNADNSIRVREYDDGSLRLTANKGYPFHIAGMWMSKNIGGNLLLQRVHDVEDE